MHELDTACAHEVLINLPPYEQRTRVKPASGWGDWPALTIKQRLVSANKENGAYISTAFIGVQAPTGEVPFTNDSWVITSTFAAGKGWRDFDIQVTVGVPVPLEHERTIGTSIVSSAALQYHFAKYFWPEFEFNYTHWADGDRGGKDQVFLMPGLILGRFTVADHSSLIVGAGYHFAVTPKSTTPPPMPATGSSRHGYPSERPIRIDCHDIQILARLGPERLYELSSLTASEISSIQAACTARRFWTG